MIELPLYCKEAHCPKCDFGCCITKHHGAKNILSSMVNPFAPEDICCNKLSKFIPQPSDDSKYVYGCYVVIEHMSRKCPNCTFMWAELPADYDPTKDD